MEAVLNPRQYFFAAQVERSLIHPGRIISDAEGLTGVNSGLLAEKKLQTFNVRFDKS